MSLNAEDRNKERQITWLRALVGDSSQRHFALSVGLSPRTFHNWMRRESIPADGVIYLALHTGIDPVQALVDTGYLPVKYRTKQLEPLKNFTNSQIADELASRLDPNAASVVKMLLKGDK